MSAMGRKQTLGSNGKKIKECPNLSSGEGAQVRVAEASRGGRPVHLQFGRARLDGFEQRCILDVGVPSRTSIVRVAENLADRVEIDAGRC